MRRQHQHAIEPQGHTAAVGQARLESREQPFIECVRGQSESHPLHPVALEARTLLGSGGELVLGPFQGKPACVRIALGKGVCGTAASQRATVRVGDVHAFPGHIACDPASRAEIVIPLIKAQQLVGVLDIDSPELGRFDEIDQRGLEALAAVMINASHA